MISIVEQKANLRKEMLSQRAHLDKIWKAGADERICERLLEITRKRNCKRVHAYITMGTEIDILPLIRQLLVDGIQVVCPKALPKGRLENRILYSLDKLEGGVMGTRHPADPDLYDGTFDMIVVPGLAFDKERFRLGYGGGYYDRFLAASPMAYKPGIFYDFQLVDHVPREPHDCRLDDILVVD